MADKRTRVEGVIKINTYDVLTRAVEEGVESGWRRAHKHVDAPGEFAILEAIKEAVVTELCEVLRFE